MPDHQTLSDLLGDLFSPDELLNWLRRLPGGEDLPRSRKDIAPATLAVNAEDLLRRHGYIDAALFDGLAKARPRREAEIRALQRRLLGEPSSPSAPPSPSGSAPSARPAVPSPLAVQILRVGTSLTIASGALIAPRVVLTARRSVGADPRQLQVRLSEGAAPSPVLEIIVDPRDPSLDVALLKLAQDQPALPALLKPRPLTGGERWELSGYPAQFEGSQNLNRRLVSGHMGVLAGAPGVNLALGQASWAGLSGAGVCVDGQLAAVLGSAPKDWVGGLAQATPAAIFLHRPWFLAALGLADADEQLRGEAEQLVHEIRDALKEAGALRPRMRVGLQAPSDDAEHLARVVVGAEGARVVTTLCRVATDAGDLHQAEQTALRRIIDRILPYAIDWRLSVAQARTQVIQAELNGLPEPSCFELSYATHTVAEIVMAGVEGRPCSFVPLGDSILLSGASFMSWPVAADPLVPIRGTAAHVGEAIVEKLARELGLDCGLAGGVLIRRLAVELRVPLDGSPRSLLALVEARLKQALRDRDEAPWRRHVVVVDDSFDDPRDGLRAWELARAAIGSRLPSLRLVHLTGTGDQMRAEANLVTDLGKLYDKTGRTP